MQVFFCFTVLSTIKQKKMTFVCLCWQTGNYSENLLAVAIVKCVKLFMLLYFFPSSNLAKKSSKPKGWQLKTKWNCFYYLSNYKYYLISINYLSLIGIILRWGFLIWELIFYLLRTFCLHLGNFFVLFLLSLRFGQISPLAFFRWFTATSDRNAESCNRIPSNYCLP